MELKKHSVKRLAKLMKINSKLAQLNFERFQDWGPPFNPSNAKQAILTFKGDVYNGLGADTFDLEDFDFAQQNLVILAGLYVLLKSLDLMQPYRLKMGTHLKTRKWKNLYDFWGYKITEAINQMFDNDVLINLASNEYFKAININLLIGKIITPVFKEFRNGSYKFMSVFGKKARGLMTSYIIKNRLENPEEIKLFEVEGYFYNDQLSEGNHWVFTRG